MSKFEEFFDDFKGRAKTVYGTASKVTSDVVDMGKVRYQIKQTQWEIEKTYAKLGAICYETKKGGENLEEVRELAIAEIDALNEKLEELEKRLRTYKKVGKCSSCGKENDVEFSFCSRCGTPLEKFEPEPAAEVSAQEASDSEGDQAE